jgi:hypothetical protein
MLAQWVCWRCDFYAKKWTRMVVKLEKEEKEAEVKKDADHQA